ncbi:FeoB small GTPase domain-containing protein [Chloroflexota bacterium]
MKILLMGNPNVGKSVIFSHLTGVHVVASNYAGTTVDYTRGFMKLGEEAAEVIDVPGAYTLEPTTEAEEVASQMLNSGDIIINVVNATNLERNLYLTLQLLEKDIPVVVALNMWDDTEHLGIHIDLERLEELLGVPVIPTVAITGEGIKELVESIPKAASPDTPAHSRDELWAAVGSIIEQVQRITHRHHTWFERLGDASVKPLTGGIIRVTGKGNKERLVRIGLKTQKALWSYLARRDSNTEYVWIGRENQPFTATGIAQMVRKMGKSLNLSLSPHKLRHSFAISFLRNGANPFELQIALGHSTLEMTRRYAQALGFEDVFKRHVMASPVDRLIH